MGKKLTPAMEQWWEFKRKNFDCVLFFKVGKFYELFHMDADIGVKEFDSSVTGNSPMVYMKGAKAHAGFPETSYGKFSKVLASRGYRVARVEQMETPAMLAERKKHTARGERKPKVVMRQICSVLTPGTRTQTFMDEDMGESEGSSILLALSESVDGEGHPTFGVCFVDTTTAQFKVGQFEDDRQRNRLRTLLANLRPTEVVYPNGILSEESQQVAQSGSNGRARHSPTEADVWRADGNARQMLAGYVGPFRQVQASISSALATAGALEQGFAAFSGLLHHLKRCLVDAQLAGNGSLEEYVPTELMKDAEVNSHSSSKGNPESYPEPPRHMVLDSHSLRNLEIFENSSDGTKANTLLEKFETGMATPFGKRLMKQWLSAPLCSIPEIEQRLDAVEFLLENMGDVQELRADMKVKADLERLLTSLHGFGSSLSPPTIP